MPTALLLPPPPGFSDLPTTLLCLVCLMACLLAAGCLGVISSPTPYKSTMLTIQYQISFFYWRKIRNKMYLHIYIVHTIYGRLRQIEITRIIFVFVVNQIPRCNFTPLKLMVALLYSVLFLEFKGTISMLMLQNPRPTKLQTLSLM